MHFLMNCYQNATHICDPEGVPTRFLALPYTYYVKIQAESYSGLCFPKSYIHELYDIILIKQMFYTLDF